MAKISDDKIKTAVDPFELLFRSGVDFNRQEFEIDYAEDDSLLIDEVQKPYLGMEVKYLVTGHPEGNSIRLYGDVRSDKENLQGDTGCEIKYNSGNVSGSGTNTITIAHTNTFASETGYYVLIDATCFKDSTGNYFPGYTSDTQWNFTTADVLTQTPTLTAPAAGAR